MNNSASPADVQRVRAMMRIAVEAHAIEPLLDLLRADPAVTDVHAGSGRREVVALVRTDDLDAFDVVLARIRAIPGITGGETSLLLSAHLT